MPQFFYNNPLGQREQIFPLVRSSVPNFYICENQKAIQLNIHESCIITEHSEEEVNEARQKFLEKNFGNLLHSSVRNSNQSAQSSLREKSDK